MPLPLLPLLLMRSGLAQAAPPPASTPVSLSSELPAGHVLDGDLGEWTRPPDLRLGESATPPGETSVWPDDFAGKAWWVFTPDGLVLAAEVHDDKVLLPGPGQDPLFSDHLALWAAGAAPDLPPLGFENERGLQLVRAPADCATLNGVDNPDACKAWFAAQGPHRTRLAHLFLRQYVLAPAGITEVWSGNCRPEPLEEPPLSAAACTTAKIAIKAGEGGYRLEALIPTDALPATAELPMTGLRLMLEAVDNDEGYNVQESFFSSAPNADPNRPATLPRFALSAPWFPDSAPPLFAAVETHDPNTGLFYFPTRPLKTAYVFENLALGGQSSPSRPSPEWSPLDWSAPKVVGSLVDLQVFQVPGQGRWCVTCKVDQRLVVMRGAELVEAEDIDDATVKAAVAREEALHLFLEASGTATPLGTGPGGAEPHHAILVKSMDAEGSFSDLFRDDITENTPDEAGITYQGVTVFVAPDGNSFGFKGLRAAAGEEPKPFVRTDRWDAEGGAYGKGADVTGK